MCVVSGHEPRSLFPNKVWPHHNPWPCQVRQHDRSDVMALTLGQADLYNTELMRRIGRVSQVTAFISLTPLSLGQPSNRKPWHSPQLNLNIMPWCMQWRRAFGFTSSWNFTISQFLNHFHFFATIKAHLHSSNPNLYPHAWNTSTFVTTSFKNMFLMALFLQHGFPLKTWLPSPVHITHPELCQKVVM